MTDPKKMAWIAICGGICAIFAGAIGEALSASHAIAVVCAVLGGALGAAIAFYFDRHPPTPRAEVGADDQFLR